MVFCYDGDKLPGFIMTGSCMIKWMSIFFSRMTLFHIQNMHINAHSLLPWTSSHIWVVCRINIPLICHRLHTISVCHMIAVALFYYQLLKNNDAVNFGVLSALKPTFYDLLKTSCSHHVIHIMFVHYWLLFSLPMFLFGFYCSLSVFSTLHRVKGTCLPPSICCHLHIAPTIAFEQKFLMYFKGNLLIKCYHC